MLAPRWAIVAHWATCVKIELTKITLKSVYDQEMQEMPKSHMQTNPWHHEEDTQNNKSNDIKIQLK